jgi:hypothetical protein
MDESFYYLLLAIPATCAFWFLCATLVGILANWLTCRRLRNYKPETSSEAGAPRMALSKIYSFTSKSQRLDCPHDLVARSPLRMPHRSGQEGSTLRVAFLASRGWANYA